MNDVQHCVLAQSAARVCTSAHLAYAHEHSIIHYPAPCRRVPHRVPVQRAHAYWRGARIRARKHAILHERCVRRLNTILEHAGPVLGSAYDSALGKIGQGVNRGW